MLYHVFDTEQHAVSSCNAVSNKMGCPRRGLDMRGKPAADDKQKTERWDVPRQRLDGKWVYARPPDESIVGTPHYTIEEYTDEWFLNDSQK